MTENTETIIEIFNDPVVSLFNASKNTNVQKFTNASNPGMRKLNMKSDKLGSFPEQKNAIALKSWDMKYKKYASIKMREGRNFSFRYCRANIADKYKYGVLFTTFMARLTTWLLSRTSRIMMNDTMLSIARTKMTNNAAFFLVSMWLSKTPEIILVEYAFLMPYPIKKLGFRFT